MKKNDLKQTLLNVGMIFSFGIVIGCIVINFLWRIQGRLFENDWAFALERIAVFVEDMLWLPTVQTAMWLMVPYCIIFLLGFWKYGKMLIEGLIFCVGFLVGGIETIWILNFNWKDGMLFFANLFLKTILMVVFLMTMAVLSITKSEEVLRKYTLKKGTKTYLFWSLVSLIFVLVYIIFRTYVNL